MGGSFGSRVNPTFSFSFLSFSFGFKNSLPTNQTLLVHIFTQISLDHFAKGEQDQTPRSRYLVTLDNLNKHIIIIIIIIIVIPSGYLQGKNTTQKKKIKKKKKKKKTPPCTSGVPCPTLSFGDALIPRALPYTWALLYPWATKG